MRTENEQHPQHFDVKLVMEPAETINNQIAVMETLAEMQAQDLCEWFKEERKKIQALLGAATTKQEYRERFAPLSLHARMHKGTLEIYWSEIKGKTKPDASGKTGWFRTRMNKGKRHSYDVNKLAAKARDYELPLVLEAERRATSLRDFWSRVVSLRLALRMINKQVEELSAVPTRGTDTGEVTQLVSPTADLASNEVLAHDTQVAASAEFPQSGLAHHQRAVYD
ncbi:MULTISPECIES: conjugative transfer protein MobI(A/C) [Xanthomonas]|uniref:Uncharacterized protein n=3 Tax=Xanthomonas TaxID=338 RepID=A0A6V7FHX7_9XANT|nr:MULTISPECIES: conjugative transfer protein MobI(A/C) [Xanthomonas]MBD5077697.1 hypothetical protein [Xanthomonas citri pv. citri]KLC02046.1 hypothetical protein XP315_21080 [Xanthomonas perforans]KLC11179.1 hypothetical protein XP4B_13635 [Xanthomonas perforans]KLC15431.1 hypothetical protein XP56_16580 [Xanthomonas perforans]KLC36689.1 hypothetical protein XP112_10650 [Xanthomonas perforans]